MFSVAGSNKEPNLHNVNLHKRLTTENKVYNAAVARA